MAVIKYGAIVTEIKGKIGGTVFQGGISGPVAGNKAHVSISNVTLGKQQRSTADKIINQHAVMAWAATNWKNLTTSEQDAWKASAIDFPFKNKFGELYTASGYQVYMQLAINAWNLGNGLIIAPPHPSTLAVANNFTIAPVTTDNTFNLTSAIDINTSIFFYASVQQSPGAALRRSLLKVISILNHGASFPIDITAAYKKVFGNIPLHGTAWFSAVPYSQIDFRQGLAVNLQYKW